MAYNKPLIVVIPLIFCLLFGAWWLYLDSNRYEIVPTAQGFGAFKYDRKTGETWYLSGNATPEKLRN